jgi:hypothetical protein
MLLKLFHKTEREGVFPNSFYEAGITLIPKANRHNKHRKDQFPS